MHDVRTVPHHAFIKRFQELVDAKVDIDMLPGELEIRDVMRLPIERLRIVAEANAALVASLPHA
jgi:hypothetical protein